MNTPKSLRISVITVCYNSASTLEKALRSVADQSWPLIEHIVIDGGSTDGTLQIIEKFGPHLAKIISEPDQGIYDAMNKGLAHASGDIICFLNADDHYAWPGALAEVAQQMQEHHLEALLGDVAFFHADNPERIVRRYRSDRFHPARLAWGWQPAHPALFLRRSVIERVGRFKTSYRIAGDFEFILRAFHDTDLRYRHFSTIFVRMQTGGASTGGIKSKIRLNREVLRACRENGLRTNMLKILSKYPLKLLELVIR
ncbi:glycosyltransferase family 2 protein [Herbaspirillum sp. GW103]|uniref:glycosyltransferase family 2 protein n=1 Tax=Herbaspirillum sp. GW103 TaxID=1175306 RepID=UPI00055102D8|nr:glycosyltransferase family 2 protein [Herbaspirillum sp. GW103]